MNKILLELEKSESNLVKRLALELSKPTRRKREVNLSRINSNSSENEVIIVPGKVLGGGELDHKITISAFNFSEGAIAKLEKSGSKIIPILELVKEPEGKKIRILG